MQPAGQMVSDEFGAHVEADLRALGIERLDAHADRLVEGDRSLERFAERIFENALFDGASAGAWGRHSAEGGRAFIDDPAAPG
ncbi:hypothetical protein M6I34_04015 [Burkholderiaceae bacterium FT117]|uniref:hypothetical protein n=1 Tax=Zeimonas sediminis TaxID=2944268 RepID=UPI002342D3F6|nr:hypothetical protein [Zeimonas sediminis]MCM5569666.1 hypothetical protein [Zeimonas sediminis]